MRVFCFLIVFVLFLPGAGARGEAASSAETSGKEARPSTAPSPAEFDKAYEQSVRPLLKRYCHECHSAEDAEADIDLEHFTTMAEVRRAFNVWMKVCEMLDSW